MKSLFIFCFIASFIFNVSATKLDDSLVKISNFHFVSEKLASSGLLDLGDYKHINQYGFKHVINLIPGDQAEERKTVESLGLSYEQIPVDWNEPTLQDFEDFVELMKKYGEDKIYIHCEANFRASTFVFLYRVTQLGVSQQTAKKDLMKIWHPSETWQGYIEKVLFAEQD
jgi:protein tyrosine phosphatase (PTP) superfamily phosphohydrolase (DUF442 family)